MSNRTATAVSCSNIAFVKYWGNRDAALRLPANGSLSMNLSGLETRTTVTFDPSLAQDEAVIDGAHQSGRARERVAEHLGRVRALAGLDVPARVQSASNFPAGAGIASSASAFAALTLAACAAAGLSLSERELSALARLGSGSAARSVPGGFVEWSTGDRHEDSVAWSIAPPEHWALVDIVAVVSREHKAVGSTDGHALAGTSPLQAGRLTGAAERLATCRRALLARDFAALAEVVEADSTLMHAVMMTSRPPLYYWQPATLTVMAEVRAWRSEGLPVCFTIDAGPNVHCICEAPIADEIERRVRGLPGVVDALRAAPGGPARLIEPPGESGQT
jgi:diphosphomevalonate decarboxylase